MSHLSDEAMDLLIDALRPLAVLAPFYQEHPDDYAVHGIGIVGPPHRLVITVFDLRRAKVIVDAFDDVRGGGNIASSA